MSTIVLTFGGIEVQTDAQQQRVSQQLAQAQQSVRTAAEEGWIAALNPQPKTLAVFCISAWSPATLVGSDTLFQTSQDTRAL